MTLVSPRIVIVALIASLVTACAPVRPDVPVGQLGLVMDMTSFNRGQCDVVGEGFEVEKISVLNGDYFKVVGNVYNSQLQCRLPDGSTVATTTHHQFFDQGGFNYAAIIVGRVRGVGPVPIYGYNDGPSGKVDVDGVFVFEQI